MCQFYCPDGATVINSRQGFIDLYNQIYYYENNRFTENAIDNLVYKDDLDKIDLIRILAWKMGKINFSQCTEEEPFKYAKDWERAEEMEVLRYNKPLEIQDWVRGIESNYAILKKDAIESPQDFLNRLNENSPEGIGTVYMITILYFISKGQYPIYDRFAFKGLMAICNCVIPGQEIKPVELPSKIAEKFSNVMNEHIQPFKAQIDYVFGEGEYQKSRDIDRALWIMDTCSQIKFNIVVIII